MVNPRTEPAGEYPSDPPEGPMVLGAAGFAGSTAASRNAIPSALPPPHW
ncbi:hypothetical protein Acsp05_60030 [Actinokineospora sp. NBRC 105648]|nr:hypothetical protein Acsp05_60030 [Actinokineospora sp. NBRC 105648]